MSNKVKPWTANQERFIDWLTLTRFDRIPATQEELAAKIGVRPETLTRWKRDQRLHEEVKRRVHVALRGARGDIYGALIREATKGSYHHIKLALEILGDIGNDKPQWKIEIVNLVQQNVISLEQVKEEFGEDLVAELFNATVATSS